MNNQWALSSLYTDDVLTTQLILAPLCRHIELLPPFLIFAFSDFIFLLYPDISVPPPASSRSSACHSVSPNKSHKTCIKTGR
mmetsp:Transcript_13205/g.28651  ORF Transcript_13205/g.28651 Transcript_13205/m.28651 type:complete len:82 (+) Transcript_13205:712-957(+)